MRSCLPRLPMCPPVRVLPTSHLAVCSVACGPQVGWLTAPRLLPLARSSHLSPLDHPTSDFVPALLAKGATRPSALISGGAGLREKGLIAQAAWQQRSLSAPRSCDATVRRGIPRQSRSSSVRPFARPIRLRRLSVPTTTWHLSGLFQPSCIPVVRSTQRSPPFTAGAEYPKSHDCMPIPRSPPACSLCCSPIVARFKVLAINRRSIHPPIFLCPFILPSTPSALSRIS